MRFSYNKLFKLLIDRGINKKTLREMSGISATSVAKLGKGGNVNTDVLLRICGALKCDVGDIMEFIQSLISREQYRMEEQHPPKNNME